jgi:hypothetical protein
LVEWYVVDLGCHSGVDIDVFSECIAEGFVAAAMGQDA